jgi:hypothetical protein
LSRHSGAAKRLSAPPETSGPGRANPHQRCHASFQVSNEVCPCRILKSAVAAMVLSGRLMDRSQTVRNARAISAQSTGITWCNGFKLSASSAARRIEFRIESLAVISPSCCGR